MRKLFCKPPFLVCLALVAGVQSLHANIPEPDVVFFGQVTGKVGALDVPVTEGQLSWEIRPKESSGAVYKYQVDLAKLSGGEYSYSLKIPQEVLVDIDTLMPQQENGLSIEAQKELFLKHYSISVNGEQAVLKDESLAFFASSQQNRAPYIQLDLEVSADALGDELDKNGNGIPDAWESHYNISDISADDDGDGWSNEDEYKGGTDPSVNNRVPLLSGENGNTDLPEITLYENGLVQLRLSVADSDSQPEELSLVLGEMPAGLQLYHVDAMDQTLSAGDMLSAADLQAGKLFARYKPDVLLDEQGNPIEPGEWLVSLQDAGPLHNAEMTEGESNAPIQAKVHLKVFRPSTIADPVRWIDGMAYRNSSDSVLPGRSGSASDRLLTYHYDRAEGAFVETGAEITVDEGGLIEKPAWQEMLAFEEPDNVDDRLDLSGNRSLFIAYSAESVPYENNIFNDGRINLSDAAHYLVFGPTSTQEFIASTKPVKSDVDIAAAHTIEEMSILEHDGIRVGGSVPHKGEVTTEASSLSGFGFALGAYGEYPGVAYQFEGQLGEFIAFPSALEGIEKYSVSAFLLSKWKGYSVFDASRATSSTRLVANESLTNPVIMLGGVADDLLVSTGQDSIMFGGAGSDILSGSDGQDRFIVSDGDKIRGFAEYSTFLIKDVLDLTHLLPLGNEPLEKCIYFSPVGSDTTVSVNTACTGEDFVYGSDYVDAKFTIEGQGLWNTDIPVLWRTGALFAGGHRPGAIEAGLSAGDDGSQTGLLSENTDGENLHHPIYLAYEGGQPFEGKDLSLQLSFGGNATPVEDYSLTLKRFIDPKDSELVSSLSNAEYTYDDLLYSLTGVELEAIGVIKEESRFTEGQYHLFQRYDVLKDLDLGNGVATVSIPAQLTEDNESHKRLVLDLEVKQDQTKEDDETITIKLLQVPEYFDLAEGKDDVTITISDGLDRVYATNTKATVSEGQSGSFTLHRTGSIDQPLVVDVMLSGLAENGTDYSTIPSQLTFAEGEDTLTIPVQAMTDEVSEPMELLELRIVSSDRYEIDATRNLAQLTIQDEALNFVDTDKDGLPDSWELASGLNPNVSNLQGDGYRDSDGDGLSDQDEYRLGTDPMKADSDGDGVADGSDAAPLDAEVKDMQGLKGYQVVQLGTQSVLNVPLGMDRIIDVPLHYLTSDGSDQANGLQLMLQYNADQLEYLGVNQVMSTALASTGSPTPKAVYRGGYKLFTHQVPVTWDASGGDWPGMPLPTALLHARFKLPATATVGQQLMIGVDADAAEGYAFRPVQLQVNVVAPSQMEILANEQDVAEEGIMLARHLAGLSPEMPKMTAEEASEKLSEDELARIVQHIHTAGLQYDVDGDGVVNPLSDAVLIYHYLKNGTLTDEQVQQVLGADTSVTAADVIAKIREIQEAL